MYEDGCVSRIDGEVALVRVLRGTACDNCSSSGACKSLGGGRDMEVEANNIVGAEVGDRVRVEIPSSSVAKMAFLVYLIPIMSLVLGAMLGMEIGATVSLDPELCALGTSLACFSVAFFIVRRIGQILADNQDYTPRISKVL